MFGGGAEHRIPIRNRDARSPGRGNAGQEGARGLRIPIGPGPRGQTIEQRRVIPGYAGSRRIVGQDFEKARGISAGLLQPGRMGGGAAGLMLLVANVPVKLLLDRLSSPWEMAELVAAGVVCFLASEGVWRKSVRHYTSASS